MNYRNVQNIQSILFCLSVLVIGNVSGFGLLKHREGQHWRIAPIVFAMGMLALLKYETYMAYRKNLARGCMLWNELNERILNDEDKKKANKNCTR